MSQTADRPPIPGVPDRDPSSRLPPFRPDAGIGASSGSSPDGMSAVPLPLAPMPSARKPLRVVHVTGTERVRELCPYLMAADRSHRSSVPASDHRCTAVAPASPLSSEKQRRLCLTADHRTCATFAAAVARRPIDLGSGTPTGYPLRRPYARTTPILLEQPRLAIPSIVGSPSGTQLFLAGLMAVAFAAILVGRAPTTTPVGVMVDPSATAHVASPTPSTVVPSRAPARTLPPTGSQPPAGGPGASVGAPAVSQAVRTYKVRSGDTLSGIAARFGTTIKVLMELNPIRDPSKIRVGTVLILP